MKRLHKVAETYYRITYKTSDGDWTAECHVLNGKRQSYCISNKKYYYFERALRTLNAAERAIERAEREHHEEK